MDSITSLSFSKTMLTEEGVKAVASFPHLKQLGIGYSWRDTSLESLRYLKSLETLELDELPITEERIALMKSLPNLREVDLEDFEAVSKDDIENLRKLLPNVKVRHNELH